MLTAIGLTLIVAAMTAVLGFEKNVKLYVRSRDPRYCWSILAQVLMAVWFFVAGMRALVSS